MKRKAITGLILSIIAVVCIVGAGLNVNAYDNADVDAIKTVLMKSQNLASKTYVDAKQSSKRGTLQQDKENIIKIHSEDVKDVFSDQVSDHYIRSWIEKQPARAIDGPDTIDAGVTGVEINKISIDGNNATVNATVSKYFIDRIQKEGKNYLDKLEGNVNVEAILVKENGKWKIAQYNISPDFDSAKHTLTLDNQ